MIFKAFPRQPDLGTSSFSPGFSRSYYLSFAYSVLAVLLCYLNEDCYTWDTKISGDELEWTECWTHRSSFGCIVIPDELRDCT